MIGFSLDAFSQVAREKPEALRDLARMKLTRIQPDWSAYDVTDLKGFTE
jgi:hypothetical protein